MAKTTFHNRYNPKEITQGLDFTNHAEVCNQQLAEECEIRSIIEQFETGKISDLPAVRQPVYNDKFITPQTYDEALALIESVKTDFYNLPVETQRKFGDIQNYISDMYKIANGDSATLTKYNGYNVGQEVSVSQTESVSVPDTSDTSSSSLSRGDTKTPTE